MTKKKSHSAGRRGHEKRRPFSKRHPVGAELARDVVCLGTIAVATLIVYHRATHYFFAQDDFVSLWVAKEGPQTFWRILSSFVYFRTARSLFGLNPVAFHCASLFFHILNGALIFFIARAFSGDRMASLVAATLFVVHPALYPPIYAISSIGEILSCLFVLLASLYLIKASKPGGLVPVLVVSLLFAASLLSKETTIAFPVLAGFIFLTRGMGARKALPVLAALVVVALAYGVLFYSADVFQIKEALSGTLPASKASTEGPAPYALSLGPQLLTCLQTYLKWTFNIFEEWRGVQFNILDPHALVWLAIGVAVFLLLIGRRGSHRMKSAYGILWFLLMLLPVIPLANHPYHYYLYLPLAGLCPAIAVLLARWLKRSRGETLASVCIILFLVANSTLMMSRVENTPVGRSERRQETICDRALVAGNLIGDLRHVEFPPGAKLVLISPRRDISEGKLVEDSWLVATGTYWDTNVRCAVADGLGIRLFCPDVDTVAFTVDLKPEHSGFCAVGYRWNGHLRSMESYRKRSPAVP